MKKLLKEGFFRKILIPALLAIIMFIISVFAFVIPSFKNNAIQQKQIMLQELTNTAWSILKKYQLDEKKGLLTTQEAQNKAIIEIEALRYGSDKKDYFWITDLTPIMIMHPYFHELIGENLKDFADPDGKKLFLEAVQIAKTKNEGFFTYKWQLKDDSTHIVPKLSFVKLFPEWNWIIGTGIYLVDVQHEINILTHRILLILFVITVIISMFILFITFQSLKIETKRRQVEKELHDSKEKYKSLLESSTEGLIFLMESSISYSNSFIQNWLGYTSDELSILNIDKIITNNNDFDYKNIKKEVKKEIELLKKDGQKTLAILTVMPVQFTDKEGLLLTFKDTNEQFSVKKELEIIKKQLHNISQFSNIGLFRFSLTGKNRLMSFNQKVVTILGYSSENELFNTPLISIFANKEDIKILLIELKEKFIVSNRIVSFRKNDNSIIDVYLTLNLTKIDEQETICDGIIETIDNKQSKEEINIISQNIASIFANSKNEVKHYSKPLIDCYINTRLSLVCEILSKNNSDYILIMLNNKCIGIITYYDLIFRYINKKIDENSFASEIMTSPVEVTSENTKLIDAITIFNTKNISHLVLINSNSEITGVLRKKDILGVCINPEDLVSKIIENYASVSEILQLRNKLPILVKPLLNEIGNISTISKIITVFNDKIAQKIIQNTIKELGQPPVSFAFLTFGSQGRDEFAFNSDQDNAIIYNDIENEDKEKVETYFKELSNRVCKYLANSGLPLCVGGYMANNPKWCQPLKVWKNYFTDWIVNAEPENILNFSVLFDIKIVFGDEKLFYDLENYIYEILQGRTAFFYFLAQTSTAFKTPLNIFGNIITETTGNKIEAIDIKSSIAQIVAFARVFALYNNIRNKNTNERINILKTKEVLSQTTYEEIIFHYNYLMQLRIKNQIEQITNNKEVTNYLLPKKLTEMQQIILKKVFSQMSSYQEKLSATFMSSYKG